MLPGTLGLTPRGRVLPDLHGQETPGELIQVHPGARLDELLEFEGGDHPERLRAPGAEELERARGVPQVTGERPAVYRGPISHGRGCGNTVSTCCDTCRDRYDEPTVSSKASQ